MSVHQIHILPCWTVFPNLHYTSKQIIILDLIVSPNIKSFKTESFHLLSEFIFSLSSVHSIR